MISLFILIPAFILVAIVIIFVWSRRRAVVSPEAKPVKFKWRYVIVPVILLLLTGVMMSFFYNKLPEQAAYHFLVDGSPDKWASPVAIVLVGLLIQAGLVFIGWVMVMIASRIAPSSQTENMVLKPESLLVWMGNLVALPQIIFGFVMLDLFSYNVYQKHLMPVWLFMVIVLVIATIGFIGFLFYMTRKALKQANK